jgi:hydroxymethylbilane synthase
MRQITIGTRGSALALAQTRWVLARLKEEWPEAEFRVQTIQTRGDADPAPLQGNRGFFTSDLENALIQQRIDIAVHSLKDLPTEPKEGLELAAVTKRLDPRDVLVGRSGIKRIAQLPQGAVVGTSSARRQAFLRALRPDLNLRALRGNVDTRLSAVVGGGYDAVILAAAGLIRLDLRQRIDEFIDPADLLPAPGQGALGLQTRSDDDLVIELAYSLNDGEASDRTAAERALLSGLGGGCMAPVGALATLAPEGQLVLEGWVASLDGSKLIKATTEGEADEAEALGLELAEDLLAHGAKALLGDLRSA